MTTLYEINTRNRDDEPEYMDNDLEERLLTARNGIELALLALHEDKRELLPTVLRDAVFVALCEIARQFVYE